MKNRLFIDPGSYSTGWALFKGPELIKSGTVDVDKKERDPFVRLSKISQQYLLLMLPACEVHLEQLVRNTHIYTHWSVGAIGAILTGLGCSVKADIPIASWQRAVDWHGDREPLNSYLELVSSEDELAAIGMGLWYTSF